jgi:hypothetical protein
VITRHDFIELTCFLTSSLELVQERFAGARFPHRITMAPQVQLESDLRQIASQFKGLTFDDDDDIATIRDFLQQLQQTLPVRKDPYAKKVSGCG